MNAENKKDEKQSFSIANLCSNETLEILSLEQNGLDDWEIRQKWTSNSPESRKTKMEARCLAWNSDRTKVAVYFSDNGIRVFTVGQDTPVVILPRISKTTRANQSTLDMLFLRPDILLWLPESFSKTPSLLVAGQNGSLYTVVLEKTASAPLGNVTCILDGASVVHDSEANVQAVTANMDGSKIAVSFASGQALYMSLKGNERKKLSVDTDKKKDGIVLQSLLYHPLSKSALAGFDDSGLLFAWNTAAADESQPTCSGIYMQQNSPVVRMSWPQTDKRHLATIGKDHVVRIWNLVKQQVIARFSRPGGSELCFLGSFALLVKSGGGGDITVHKVASGGQIIAKYASGDSKSQLPLQHWQLAPSTIAVAPYDINTPSPRKEEPTVPSTAASFITDKLNTILSTPNRALVALEKPSVRAQSSVVTLKESDTHEALNGRNNRIASSLSSIMSHAPSTAATEPATVAQLAELKKEIKADIQNLHVEMVRQFCIQATENENLLVNKIAPVLQNLMEQVKELMIENERLKSNQFRFE